MQGASSAVSDAVLAGGCYPSVEKPSLVENPTVVGKARVTDRGGVQDTDLGGRAPDMLTADAHAADLLESQHELGKLRAEAAATVNTSSARCT